MEPIFVTPEQERALLNLLPWLESVLKNMVVAEENPNLTRIQHVKPSHGVGWTRHPEVTFGDIKILRDLLVQHQAASRK